MSTEAEVSVESRAKKRKSRIHILEEERRRTGKPYVKYTLQRLKNTRFLVDKSNFLRFALLNEERLKAAPPDIRSTIRITAGLVRHRSENSYSEQYDRMRWDRIGKCADVLGVPMELLIDEDYYFEKWGWAGYRILCEAYRKGVSIEELVYWEGVSDNPKYATKWFQAWYNAIHGRAHLTWACYSHYFSQIIVFCNERLGIPIGTLVSRQLHRTNATGVYAEMRDILAVLGKRECVLVTAVAKALCDYKFSGNQDNFRRDMSTLTRWYLRGEGNNEECREEKEEDGSSTLE